MPKKKVVYWSGTSPYATENMDLLEPHTWGIMFLHVVISIKSLFTLPLSHLYKF